MSTTSSPPMDETAHAVGREAPAPSRRRRWAAAVLLLATAVAVALIVADPFGGGKGSGNQSLDNEYPTSLATVIRQPLSSQTQVSGTLGFPGSSSLRVPSGTSPSAIAQAAESVTAARVALRGQESTLSAAGAALAVAQASLTADTAKRAVDCAGDQAAQAPATGAGSGGSAGADLCASDEQMVATDQQSVAVDRSRLTGDQTAGTMAGGALTRAQQSLDDARASASTYGPGATFTALPGVGEVIHRGHTLVRIDGHPVTLLYGDVLPSRSFLAGMSAGPDVAELNANLLALGDGSGLSGDTFTDATAAAITAFQRTRGLAVTGELPLGSVVFTAGAVRVSSVKASLGGPVTPGPVLGVTSAQRRVTIALDASQQGSVKVGDPISIQLPDGNDTPGRITSIASVATTGGSGGGGDGGGGGGGATIAVTAVPTDPAAIVGLDEAPVEVSITTQSVPSALVVPVDALLALAGGGYAVEEENAHGVHYLLAVSLGLFDDADGLVQVTGAGLAADQRVVVPGS